MRRKDKGGTSSDSMVLMRAPTEAQLRFAQFCVKRQAAVVKDKVDDRLLHQPSSPGKTEGVTGQELLDSRREEDPECAQQPSSRSFLSRGRRTLLKVSQRKLQERRQRIAQHGFHHSTTCTGKLDEEMQQATSILCVRDSTANSSEKRRRRAISPSRDTKPQARKFDVVPSQISLLSISQSFSTLTPTRKMWRQPAATIKVGTKNNKAPDWVKERARRKEPVHNPVVSTAAPLDRGASWLVHLPQKYPKSDRPTTKRSRQPRERPKDVLLAKTFNNCKTSTINRRSRRASLSKLATKNRGFSEQNQSISSFVSSTFPTKAANNLLDNLVWNTVETDVVRFTVRVEQGLLAAIAAGSSVSFPSICSSSTDATANDQESRQLVRTVTYDEETEEDSPTSVSTDAFTAVKRMVLENNVQHDGEAFQGGLLSEENATVRLSPCFPVNEAKKHHKLFFSETFSSETFRGSFESNSGERISSAMRVLDGCVDLLDSQHHEDPDDAESVLSCRDPPVHWIQLKNNPEELFGDRGTPSKKIGKVRFEEKMHGPQTKSKMSPTAKQLPSSRTSVNANVTLDPCGSKDFRNDNCLLDSKIYQGEITADEHSKQTPAATKHHAHFHPEPKRDSVQDPNEGKETHISSNSHTKVYENGDDSSTLQELENRDRVIDFPPTSDGTNVYLEPLPINDDSPLLLCQRNEKYIKTVDHKLSPKTKKFYGTTDDNYALTKPQMHGKGERSKVAFTPSAIPFSIISENAEPTEEDKGIYVDEDVDDIPVPTFNEVRARVRNTLMESQSRWSARQKIRNVSSTTLLGTLHSPESSSQEVETYSSLKSRGICNIAQRSEISRQTCDSVSEQECALDCSSFFGASISTDLYSTDLCPKAKIPIKEKLEECCFDTADTLHHTLCDRSIGSPLPEKSAINDIIGSAKLACDRRNLGSNALETRERTMDDSSAGDHWLCTLRQDESVGNDSIFGSDQFTCHDVAVNVSITEPEEPNYESRPVASDSVSLQQEQRRTESPEALQPFLDSKSSQSIAYSNNQIGGTVEPESSTIYDRSAKPKLILSDKFTTIGASIKNDSFEDNCSCLEVFSFENGTTVPVCCDDLHEKFRTASIDWDMALVDTLVDATTDGGDMFYDDSSISSCPEWIDTESLQRELALSSYNDVCAIDDPYGTDATGGLAINEQTPANDCADDREAGADILEISQNVKGLLFWGAKTNQRIVFSLDSESAPSISHLLNSDSDCDSSDDSTVLGTVPAGKDAQALFTEIEMAHWKKTPASTTSNELDIPHGLRGHATSAIKGQCVTAHARTPACAGSHEHTNAHVHRKAVLHWSFKSAVGSMMQMVDDFGRKNFQKSGKSKQKRSRSAGCGLSTEQANMLQAHLMMSHSDGGEAIDFDVKWEKRFMM